MSIISYLISNGQSDFNELKEVTKATSGNISVQLKKLEKEKYITITKGFMNNYQRTSVEITKIGINAFEEYVKAIGGYIKK